MLMSRIFLSLLLLAASVGLPGLAEADAAQSWVVRSEYQSPIPGRDKSTIRWHFERRVSAQGEVRVLVSDFDGRVQSRAELYFDRNHALVQVDCYRQRRGQEIVEARIYDIKAPAIMNQSLVPGDWLNRELPFIVREKANEYLVKEKVGAAVFSSHLLVTEESINWAEAQAAGMIGSDNHDLVASDRPLRLVTVSKIIDARTKAIPLLRQLWAVGDSFWLYEEKDGRHSWRCQQQ
jgi:hypothetical protein